MLYVHTGVQLRNVLLRFISLITDVINSADEGTAPSISESDAEFRLPKVSFEANSNIPVCF